MLWPLALLAAGRMEAVSLESVGEPASAAVARLAEASGLRLEVSEALSREPLLVLLRDADPREAMDMIAWAVRGRWVNLSSRQELRRDDQEWARAEARELQVLSSAFANALKGPMPGPPELVEPWLTASNSTFPASAVQTLGPEWAPVLAKGKAVFSTHPTSLQRPMPDPMLLEVRRAMPMAEIVWIVTVPTSWTSFVDGTSYTSSVQVEAVHLKSGPDGLVKVQSARPAQEPQFFGRDDRRQVDVVSSLDRRAWPGALKESLEAGAARAVWSSAGLSGQPQAAPFRPALLALLKRPEGPWPRLLAGWAEAWRGGGPSVVVRLSRNLHLTGVGNTLGARLAEIDLARGEARFEGGIAALRPTWTKDAGPDPVWSQAAQWAAEADPAARWTWDDLVLLAGAADDVESFISLFSLAANAMDREPMMSDIDLLFAVARAEAAARAKGQPGQILLDSLTGPEKEILLRQALNSTSRIEGREPRGWPWVEPTFAFAQSAGPWMASWTAGEELIAILRKEGQDQTSIYRPRAYALDEFARDYAVTELARAKGELKSGTWGYGTTPGARYKAQIQSGLKLNLRISRGPAQTTLAAMFPLERPSGPFVDPVGYNGPHADKLREAAKKHQSGRS